MTREMFGAIVDPTQAVGTRNWYTVPLSILAHAAALMAVVVVPLMASGILPTPESVLVFTVAPPPPPAPVPPPQPVHPEMAAPVATNANPEAAPVEAPVGVAVEAPPPRLMPVPGVPGEIPKDVAGTGLVSLATPPPPAFVRPGGDIKEPRKIHDVRPVYPQAALAAKVEGMVIVEATISKDGSVIDARAIRSQPLLDASALDAVRQWKFTPTTLNGMPVDVVMTVTVNFTLH